MSIEMSAKIRWNIVLNATGKEWSDLQYPIGEFMKQKYLFEISSGFELVRCFDEFDLWARRDWKTSDVEFAILPATINEKT